LEGKHQLGTAFGAAQALCRVPWLGDAPFQGTAASLPVARLLNRKITGSKLSFHFNRKRALAEAQEHCCIKEIHTITHVWLLFKSLENSVECRLFQQYWVSSMVASNLAVGPGLPRCLSSHFLCFFPFTDLFLFFPPTGECKLCRPGKTLQFIKPSLSEHCGARFSLFTAHA